MTDQDNDRTLNEPGSPRDVDDDDVVTGLGHRSECTNELLQKSP